MKSLPVPVTFVAARRDLEDTKGHCLLLFSQKKIVAVCSCLVHLRMLCVVVFEAVLEEADALLGPDLVDADEVLGGRELEVLTLLVHLVGDLAGRQLAAMETCEGRNDGVKENPNSGRVIISRSRGRLFSPGSLMDNFRRGVGKNDF